MTFDYHVVWRDRIADRATTEQVAMEVCSHRGTLEHAFRYRTLSVVHVPSGAVVARHSRTKGFL